jgi:DNA-binding LacI/PurR family transcriptional regulator
MISESSNATAVQAVNDVVAVGCAEALLSHGLRIPEDISVAGFGNILLGAHFRVPLTTTRQPKFRLGSAAVDAMVTFLQGRRPDSKRLPAELIVRASTGIAPATHRLKQSKQ